MSEQEWPFVDEPDVSVLTTRQIIEQGAPIMCVTHDLEDGMWQFLHSDEVDEGDVLLVTLESVLLMAPWPSYGIWSRAGLPPASQLKKAGNAPTSATWTKKSSYFTTQACHSASKSLRLTPKRLSKSRRVVSTR